MIASKPSGIATLLPFVGASIGIFTSYLLADSALINSKGQTVLADFWFAWVLVGAVVGGLVGVAGSYFSKGLR